MDLQRNIAIHIHYHSSNSSYDAWKILVLCLYRLTWTAERHISGSSPPPRAIKFSMNCWNSLGSSVSKTGPTAENDHFYLALQTHIHFKWFSLVVVCPIPWQSLMFLLPFKKKKVSLFLLGSWKGMSRKVPGSPGSWFLARAWMMDRARRRAAVISSNMLPVVSMTNTRAGGCLTLRNLKKYTDNPKVPRLFFITHEKALKELLHLLLAL